MAEECRGGSLAQEKGVKIMTIVLGIVVVLLLVYCIGGALFLFDFTIMRKPRKKEDEASLMPAQRRWRQAEKEGIAYLQPLVKEDWWIQAEDGLRLHAAWYPAEEPTARTVIAVHGYRGRGESDFSLLCRYYHETAKCNLLLLDYRSHGQSEGKYICFGARGRYDVVAWMQELARHVQNPRVVLHGVSMGSATVLMAGGLPEAPAALCGIVADCGYTSARDEFVFQIKQMFHLPPFPLIDLSNLVCRAVAGFDYREADALRAVANIRVPVLFIHGEKDVFVPTEMGHRLYNACPAQKSLWITPGSGHALSYLDHPAEYEEKLTEFFTEISF